MRVLIDTHVLIWWWDRPDLLSDTVHALLTDPAATVHVSAVTGWEIATKVRAGKLAEMAPHIDGFGRHVAADGFRHLDVRHDHGVRGGLLDGRHGDPFDRILAAQSLIENLTLVTRDREIASFGCKVLW
jgi:PIN domain nuclease of toxin-antitoxin system